MTQRGEVLVVIVNNPGDFAIAQTQHWYRIPLASAEKLLPRDCRQPQWLAFYHTKVFTEVAHTISYYAAVTAISEVSRRELFPDQAHDPKGDQRYLKFDLAELETLPRPIVSPSLRRVTFIPTTWQKLQTASTIADLWLTN
jgi:hypothetical protein